MTVLKNLSVTSCVFMAVFVLSSVSAQNKPEPSYQSDLESMDLVRELLQDVQFILEMKMASQIQNRTVEKEVVGQGEQIQCSCSGLGCSCCHPIVIRSLWIHADCCLKIVFVPHQYRIDISLTLASHAVFTKEIDVRHLPPLCAPIPFLKFGGGACLDFSNLHATSTHLGGCVSIRITLWSFTIATIPLGCFRINSLEATQEVGAVELPYLDGQQAPVEGPEPLYLRNVLMEKLKPSEYKKK